MILDKIKLSFLCSLLTLNGYLSAQELLPEIYDSTVFEQQLIINGSVLQHASNLQNELSRKFLFGGEVSDELSQESYDQHLNSNRVGVGARFRIEYRGSRQIFKSRPNLSWMADISSNYHGYAEYSDDIFGLALLGNKSFLNETVGFNNNELKYVQFYSLGGGIHNRKNKNFVSLNVILPMSFTQLVVDRGAISFFNDGAEVGLNLRAEMLEGNANSDIKGIGGAVNFDYHIPFGNENEFNGVMKISARNLGLYHLNDAQKQKVTNEISYSGFQLDNFFGDSISTTLKDTLGITESKSSSTHFLPGFIQVGKVATHHSKDKLQSTFGVRLYTNRVYRPMVFAGVHYQAMKKISFGSQLTYGGYGNFRLGLYANYQSESIVFGIGTEDILGAFLNSQYGHSGLIRLAWKL